MATSNVFKSSTIYGILRNSDNTTASPNINANAIFDRDINVTGKVKTDHIEPTGNTIDISGNNIYLGHAGNNVYIKDVLFTEGVFAASNNTFTGTNTFNAAATIKNSLNFTNGSNPLTAKIIPVDMGGASVMKIQSRGLLYIDAANTDGDPYIPYFQYQGFNYSNPNTLQPFIFYSEGGLKFDATKLIFQSSGAIDFGTASLTRFSTPLLSDNSLQLATTEFVKEQDYVTQTNTDALYITIANPITSIAPTISTSITNKLYVDTNITNTFNSVFTGNQTYSGINTYNTLPRSNVTPTLSNQLITKAYADATYTGGGGGGGDVTAGGNNAFSGLNTFNTNLPTSTATPTTSTQLVTKNYTDSTFQTIANMSNYLSNATAGSTYAPLASPTLTGTPNAPTASINTNTTQIATTAFVNNQGYLTSALASSTYQLISSMSSYLTSATAASTYQLISNMSSYATLASPALTGTPTAPTAANGTNTTQIANTAFVIANSANFVLLSANNAFTGTNTFNTSLPTSTLTPTTSSQFVTKAYADLFQTIANMVNYVTIASTNIITGINFFTNKVYINGLDTSTNLIGFNNASSTAISADVVTF